MTKPALFRGVLDSPVGPLTLLVSSRGAYAIRFGEVSGPPGAVDSASATRALAGQLREYFRGQRRVFDLPVDLQGTAFQQQVWTALLEIPYGATTTYGALARTLGRPQAVRAVGGANRANPLPILVPCHRVIGSDGGLTGYAGRAGLDIKRRLLNIEQQ